MTFGESLETLLKEKNISKNKLAKKVNMHPSSIVYYIQGKRFPSRSTMANLAKVLNADEKTLELWDKEIEEHEKLIEFRREVRK